MDTEALLQRAISARKAQGLSVEVVLADGPFVRHCVNAEDRDAYIKRCEGRGETYRIIS